MSQELMLNLNQEMALPAHLRGADVNVSAGLLATVGIGGNRISLKGNRFRQIVNGKEEGVFEENHLDVIIHGAVPAISRVFYEGAYNKDEKAAPTCYSADGIAPPDDVKAKQSTKCEICPQNQKGSKIVNGVKIKACSYFQRLVVSLAGDLDGIKYILDVKSMGIFGDSHPQVNKYNIRDYTKLLANRGCDVGTIVTRISFDVDSSVPKLLFAPARFITPDELAMLQASLGTPELENMLKVNMTTVDLSGEVDAEAPATTQSTAAVAEAVEEVVEEVAEVEAATAAPVVQGLVMTEKAGGATYDQFVAEGWTNEDMIAEGYALAPKPAVPKPAPKPAVPPKPAASTVPAKPATAAPAQQPVAQQPVAQQPQRAARTTPAAQQPQRAARAPGRPAAAPAAAQTAKPATPAPATAKPAAAPAAARAVPTVQKGVPIPRDTTPAATVPVQETTSDAEVDDILAGLV